MSLDLWSPARAPKARPYYRTEDDTAVCGSVYFGHATAGCGLSCISTAPGHADLPGDDRCGADVNGHLFRWTTAEAAESRALLIASFEGWECLSCDRPCDRFRFSGCCSRGCFNREDRA